MITTLKAIPSISSVSDQPNLFDNDSGIYARPQNRGRAWERPASGKSSDLRLIPCLKNCHFNAILLRYAS
ncbi:MAG: hypothetical protein QNL33_20205 [Akkermansiaceae bacterium]